MSFTLAENAMMVNKTAGGFVHGFFNGVICVVVTQLKYILLVTLKYCMNTNHVKPIFNNSHETTNNNSNTVVFLFRLCRIYIGPIKLIIICI